MRPRQLKTKMVSVDKLNRSQRLPPLFPVASVVEVSSDEEGLHGAWFVAKVLPLPPKPPSNNSLFVEYKTLVSDGKRLKPLREFADISFIRPLPPTPSESEKAAPFDLNEAVDAYHLDGWWTGVVTEVLGLNRYKVFFPNPPDEIEFERSSLRLHRDWVDGRWVVPKKQIMSKLSFTPGTAVEVNLEVDHHFNIWYPGTVSKVIGEGLYAVKYDSVNKVGGHDEVVVNSNHIRRSPPSYNHKTFQLLDKVEAFCNSCWSSGIVTKLLSEERYIVYFKHTRKEKELHHSDLRLPVLWNDGIWVSSSQNSSVISNSEETTAVCANGKDTSAVVKESDKKSKGEDQAVPSGKFPLEGTSMSTTKRVSKKPVMERNATPNRASKKEVIEGNAIPIRESKSQVMEDNATPNTVSKHQVMEGNATPNEVSKNQAAEDKTTPSRASEWSNKDTTFKAKLSEVLLMTPTAEESTGKIESGIKTSTSAVKVTPCGKATENTNQSRTLSASQDKKLNIQEVKGGLPTNEKTPPRRRGWPKGKLRGSPRPSSAKTQKDRVAKESLPGSSGKPVIISLPCSVLGNNMYDGSPRHVPEEETIKVLKEQRTQFGDIVQYDGTDNKVLTNEVTPTLKRKRGRPFGSKNRSAKAIKSKPSHERTKLSSSHKRRRNVRFPVKSVGGSAFGEVLMDFGANTFVPSKGRKVKTTMDILTAAQELRGPLELRDEVALSKRAGKDVDERRGETYDAFDDDRPLATWCLESPPLAIVHPQHSPAGNASQNGEVMERNNQTTKNAQSVTKETNLAGGVDVHASENVDQREPSMRQKVDEILGDPKSTALPFTKTSPLWQMIESMDVFKKLPQEPHFHPLYSCKEECREGLAIGGMVTFAGLVQKIPKFQFDDPRSILESSVETLVDLEKHGFDVIAIRSKLTSLLEIKSNQEQSSKQSKETEHLIKVRCQEKAELDKERIEIDRQIEELRQKRASLVWGTERIEADVVALESSVEGMKNSLEVARSEFAKVVAAPW